MNPVLAQYLNLLINLVLITLLLYGVNWLIKNVIIETFKAFTNKTKTTFDDFLIKSNFPRYIGRIIPLLIVFELYPLLFSDFPKVLLVFEKNSEHLPDHSSGLDHQEYDQNFQGLPEDSGRL